MAKTCTYCGLQSQNKSISCEHCGKLFNQTNRSNNDNLFYYYKDAINHYADFNGRCSVKGYWMFVLINSILIFFFSITMVLFLILFRSSLFYIFLSIWYIMWIIYSIFILIPSLSIAVRRLHDQSRSGWFLLLNIIPWLGNIAVLILLMMPSTPYDNAYGPYLK